MRLRSTATTRSRDAMVLQLRLCRIKPCSHGTLAEIMLDSKVKPGVGSSDAFDSGTSQCSNSGKSACSSSIGGRTSFNSLCPLLVARESVISAARPNVLPNLADTSFGAMRVRFGIGGNHSHAILNSSQKLAISSDSVLRMPGPAFGISSYDYNSVPPNFTRISLTLKTPKNANKHWTDSFRTVLQTFCVRRYLMTIELIRDTSNEMGESDIERRERNDQFGRIYSRWPERYSRN
jgi:hypothetical protein